ncbi:MAG: hypothetical protein KGJ37_01890 [Verrucomicrobiota bacterium]|nr:hypothetical protein [Verrucomicrobiota bacterium]
MSATPTVKRSTDSLHDKKSAPAWLYPKIPPSTTTASADAQPATVCSG